LIHLKTASFFFVDVCLIELILSLGQFIPSRIDSVDHIAHIVGFLSGLLLANLLRWAQRWPRFLQTRKEFLFWSYERMFREEKNVPKSAESFQSLLEINPFNDPLKVLLCRWMETQGRAVNPQTFERLFSFFSPTFIRLETAAVAHLIEKLYRASAELPRSWLLKTPYDSILRITQRLVNPEDDHKALLYLVTAYREAHPEEGDVRKKLEVLAQRLKPIAKNSAEQLKTG
jgi:hypothetical protein